MSKNNRKKPDPQPPKPDSALRDVVRKSIPKEKKNK